jgi:glycosyltransferase involved in cell wall biosynthesis
MTAPDRPIRLLTFTTLYPNAASPTHGVFVENRLRHLLGTGQVEATVLAPVPWFPSRNPAFGAWARHAAAPRVETRHGLRILHPRYPVIPRFGMSFTPMLLYAASRRAMARLREEGAQWDAIDAHYLYPDGVAAAWLARAFDLPVVLTARGSDVTQLAGYAGPRAMIRRAACDADAVITVSDGLRAGLMDIGVPGNRITTLRNGVDLTVFRPLDPAASRAGLGLSGRVLISVGALIERKGHHRTIEAMAELTDWDLIIIGEGPLRKALVAQANRIGAGSRVHLPGAMPHEDLPRYYAAADFSVLASSREGWANVLLESLACGTRVIASPIAGNTEVIRAPEAGMVMTENSASGIARAVRALAAQPVDRNATSAYAAQFSWDQTTAGQLALFRDVIVGRRAG